jgi:hypothetical protein
MPNQIIQETTKIKYKWTFNQDVETGTFWDGSPYIINKPGLKLINMEMETEFGTEKANTVVSNLELGYFGKPGFTGELYINGLVKNPRGVADYGPDGKHRLKQNQFDSRTAGCFNRGWVRFRQIRDPVTKKNIKLPIPTNADTSYTEFNLTQFLATKAQLENGGVDVDFGDVLVASWSNFDINSARKWDVASAGGYPYQRIHSRSCILSYGTLFVLEKHPTQLSFRPPVLWPEEDKKNRPIHSTEKVRSLLPDQSELVTNPWSVRKPPVILNDPTFRTFCYGFPFGGGVSYSQFMPLFSGSLDGLISAYGAYYQAPLYNRLSAIYCKDLSDQARYEGLLSVVQWGLDAFGSLKTYAPTGSGAGQKPCATRTWSIIAGYFLNEQAMMQPETTMIADVARSNGLLNNNADYPVQAKKMFWGDPATSLVAKKRWHALITSMEAICYHKVLDQPGHAFDYRVLGSSHRKVFPASGGNFQQTTDSEKYLLYIRRNTEHSCFSGTLAKMQWNSVPAGLGAPWPASHDGKSGTFWYSYIKVIEGAGAGETLYRIIKPWGDFRNAKPNTELNISGYGFILDRPWQNGQPDETSKFEMFTCTKDNIGETFYVITPSKYSLSVPDANLSPQTAYAPICEALAIRLYGWMKYIETKTGKNPDLDKDSTNAHDYINRLHSNPYGWATYNNEGPYPWEVAVLNKWYSRPSTYTEIAKTIDWSTLPGVNKWCNVDVDALRKLPGDFNNDKVVDISDAVLFLKAWGTNDPTFDMNKDGVVDINDVNLFLAKLEGEESEIDPIDEEFYEDIEEPIDNESEE